MQKNITIYFFGLIMCQQFFREFDERQAHLRAKTQQIAKIRIEYKASEEVFNLKVYLPQAKASQRSIYMQFKQEYDGLKDMMTFFQGGKNQQNIRQPHLKNVTPVKNHQGKIQNYIINVFQNKPSKCQKIKENIWQSKWPRTFREDYQFANSETLPKTSPAIQHKSKQPAAQVDLPKRKGIQNHGNTCYINSLVQCLFHLPHFNDYFADQTYITQKNGRNKDVTQMYRALYLNVARNNSHEDISTLPLKRSVSSICSLFIDWEQEDSHEFMKKLLNSIHQQLNRVQQRPRYRQIHKEVQGESLQKMAAGYWKYEKQRDDSYIYDTFCGQSYNSIRCISCNNESHTFENFLDLSIPITPNARSLDELLQDYFQPEKLSDYYFCGKCNKSSKKSTKTVQLWRVPKFLIIHLKRCQLERKNIDAITIPQSLNLKQFMGLSNDKTAKFCQYSLCGIIMHQGVLQGGHYWSNVKQNGKWFEMDDENVKQVNSDEFKKNITKNGNVNAYILFYSSLYS